jgi:hypothetical protein
VLIVALVGFLYIFIVQLFLLCFTVIFMGYSLIITLMSCVFVFVDRFSSIGDEIEGVEIELKKHKNLSTVTIEYIHLLHDDAKYWLDIIFKGSYWLSFGVITSVSILWGLAWGVEPTRGLLIFTTGFFIVYVYVLFGSFLWLFYPIYLYVEKTRNLPRYQAR